MGGMHMDEHMKEMPDPACSNDHLHGGFSGHAIPGIMFIILATWWLLNVFSIYLNSGKKTHTSRAWYLFPWKPQLPLEPILMIVLALFGMVVELLLSGHGTWRKLYASDGQFCIGHLNNWQHAAMYGAFALSGLVDLLGLDGSLPKGIESAFLAMAFFVEGELMGFHLKGSGLEVNIHLILTFIIFYCVLAILAEIWFPHSFIVSCTKCHAVFLQGTWFIHVGAILYLGNPAWDEDSMGGEMFAPVLFATHVMVVAALMLAGFVLIRTSKLHRFWGSYDVTVLYSNLEEGLSESSNGAYKDTVNGISAKDYYQD
eukprot:TRINITY_DN12103_c0_g1_i2.p1 TRINITY_DN12103_c0_g1~~TRINITY_DN12103_c0_g1_i2.p1  ORF type:complete len:314 (-),score=34.66 TRINITY_DN12103_c0_g1_i2:460-1401(-)